MKVPLPLAPHGWLAIGLVLLLSGCLGPMPRPLGGLNRRLAQQGSQREPSLSGRWLALVANRQGRDAVELVDVERQRPVPLPGLNRPDALPLSVSVSGDGDRLVVVRQVEGRTELVLHRRALISSETIPMVPAGVPRRAALRADGREIAVEVSRGGVVQVDLIAVP
ncbi:MAG: TolB family protein [Cyanobacteriota bacterium]